MTAIAKTAPTSKRELRREIQTLRAIAVLLVVVFHLWPNRLTGGYVGVDVFFVISGFLITSHILRDVEHEHFRLIRFWARRVRRLLPASLLVLAVTALAIVGLAPQQHWQQWLREIAASAVYFQNWLLAADSVDYLAADNTASPVQHFWSLSVEEQFYIVWPLLVLLAVAAAKRFGIGKRRAVFAMLAVTVATSLVVSVLLTQHDPGVAYFATPVRAWEFGAGALLAFAPSSEAVSAGLRRMASWGGLVLIGAAALVFTAATPFPGSAALLPVVGTLLVIWAGEPGGRLSTRALMAAAPAQFLGNISYSIYLWHWPLIVLMPYVLGGDLTTGAKLAVLAASVLLGWATTRFVEQPFLARSAGLRHRFTFAGAFTVTAAVVAFAGFGWNAVQLQVESDLRAAYAAVASGMPCLGAGSWAADGAACGDPLVSTSFVPSALAASRDTTRTQSTRCGSTSREDSEAKACEFGNRTSQVRIALVGDSHMQQYAGAFERVANDNGWAMDLYSKGRCPFSDVRRAGEHIITEACTGWVGNVKAALLSRDYDLVVTSQVSGVEWAPPAGTSVEDFAEGGLARMWGTLNEAGLPVAVIRDSPRPVPRVLECLLDVDTPTECDNPRATALPYDPQPGAVQRMQTDDTFLIDLTDFYCGPERCSSVIGGVLVHRDANHLTNTWSLTLAGQLGERVGARLERDPVLSVASASAG
ncbi:acyltransferase family protein [Lysobacter korlensis]|uniref:Acyltransferase family protein n=1 Tax=Lysobacter korlensis TaxID=553636 RepID=A0ABV6RTV1_9GAMM